MARRVRTRKNPSGSHRSHPARSHGEHVYAEWDEDSGSYGVFGDKGGHAYATFSDKQEAEEHARELNRTAKKAHRRKNPSKRSSEPTPSIRASRADFTKKTSILPIALGAAAVGGIAYLMLRPSTSQAATMPQLGSGSPPVTTLTPPGASGYFPSGSGTSVGLTSGPNGADPSPALVARLRGSTAAQQIFALQAMAYSTRYTDAIPDGIEGPITDGILQSTVGATRFSPTLFPAVRQAIMATPAASEFQLRTLPYTLPADLIAGISQTAAIMDPMAPSLAALPQVAYSAGQTRPAGQSMPFAGYSRIPNASPGNTVGQNPGYGVMTDPSGLNIGLWQFFTSRYAPSGDMNADLNRNPLAGQNGGFFQGYPGMEAMIRMGR